MTLRIVESASIPETGTGHDLVNMLDLLLHELRTPVGIAQGYIRLLLEDRLADPQDRRRALAQAMEALGRVSDLCVSADEYMDAASPSEIVRYSAAEFVRTLQDACRGMALSVAVPDPIPGHVRSLSPARATGAIAVVLRAALRGDPLLAQMAHVGIRQADLVLTTGDDAVREQLLAVSGRAAFNPWRGGTGLLVPLALRRLAQTTLRIWALSETSGAVAIAIPLELDS